jgi:hypothetical protein
MAADGGAGALFFPTPGKATLDLAKVSGTLQVDWISIDSGEWGPTGTVAGGAPVEVGTPGPGLWVAALFR